MVDDLRAWMRRRAPGIGWRDERLAERADQVRQLRLQSEQRRLEIEQMRAGLATAKQQAAGLREDLDRQQAAHQRLRSLVEGDGAIPGWSSPPSFRRRLQDLRRGTSEQLRTLDPDMLHPLRQIPRKLSNYRLAASHGVPVPRVFAVWRDLEELDLRGMPDVFVLKSDRGAGGRGVLPLQRVRDGVFERVGRSETFTHQEVVDHLRNPSLGGPFFAEELLTQPDGSESPDDIKFYMFYGEVGHILLRRMVQRGTRHWPRFRFLDEAGVDLGEDVAPFRRINETIQPPARLNEYLEVARHLSRATAVPFIRVDVYETARGPVFGELTRGPGGAQRYREDHDRHLGRLWDEAQYRLDLDVVAGRPLRNLLGEHAVRNFYSVGHRPADEVHRDEQSAAVPCDTWCLREPDHGIDGAAMPSSNGVGQESPLPDPTPVLDRK